MATKHTQIPRFVIKSFIYKGKLGEVKVNVSMDFSKNEVSLLDENRNVKQWVFARRGLEYMDGWLDILDAMKYAVEEAKKEMLAFVLEDSGVEVEPVIPRKKK